MLSYSVTTAKIARRGKESHPQEPNILWTIPRSVLQIVLLRALQVWNPSLQLKLPDVEEDLPPQMDLSQDFALLDEDGRAGENVSASLRGPNEIL